MDAVEKTRMHQPKPFYLDYLIVIEISRCSGHSRRTSLWQLITSRALDAYILNVLDKQAAEDFVDLRNQYRSRSFAFLWRESLSERQKSMMQRVVYALLENLRCTGVGPDESLQTWDITSHNRIDGRRVNPNWTSMVKDGTGSSAFVVMTNNCFGCGNPHPDPQAMTQPFLRTRLCITVKAPTKCDTKDASDFSRWRVKQPSTLNAQDCHRLELVERARLSSMPEMSSILGRQTERKQNNLDKIDRGDRRAYGNTQNGLNGCPETFSLPASERITEKQKEQSLMNGGELQDHHTAHDTGESSTCTPPSAKDEEHEYLEPSKENISMTYCDRILRFRGGNGRYIGTLALQCRGNGGKVNLSSVPEKKPLSAAWRPDRELTIAAIPKAVKAKARELDGAAIRWVRRTVANPLPCMVEPDAVGESPQDSAVEHLRGGELSSNQITLSVHVC